MLWSTHPRRLGLLITAPAVPAMIALVHWTLEPASEPPPPMPTGSLVAHHDEVRTALSRPVEDRRGPWTSTAPVADAGADGGPDAEAAAAERMTVHAGGRAIGWVMVDPGRLAEAARTRLEILRVEAMRAEAAELTKRARFAEAARMAEQRPAAPSRGGRALVRDDRVRLWQSAAGPSSAPAFRRPDFVEALARERRALDRAGRSGRSR